MVSSVVGFSFGFIIYSAAINLKMNEHFTEALVLDKKDNGELDAVVVFYTENFGKISAKAKSLKKITSKLSGHLEPLNFVNIRLIEKNGFQVVDALTTERLSGLRKDAEKIKKCLKISRFVEEMTFDGQKDGRIYLALKKILQERRGDFDERPVFRFLLKILGFDPEFASCSLCGKENPAAFVKEDALFLCGGCSSKIKEDKIIYI